jgi:putative NADH-flavin reductase
MTMPRAPIAVIGRSGWADGVLMVRSASSRVSNHELAAILRDAAKTPLLRMRFAVLGGSAL